MKEGDLITTTWRIPKIPVKPIEGNSYPLGALPSGTRVCLLQKYHDSVAKSEKDLYYYNENTSGTLLKKVCVYCLDLQSMPKFSVNFGLPLFLF